MFGSDSCLVSYPNGLETCQVVIPMANTGQATQHLCNYVPEFILWI